METSWPVAADRTTLNRRASVSRVVPFWLINGARATNNNFTLDGVDNNESQFGQIAIYPNPDAIAEFKIESSVPSAESGRAGGGVISTTFKSGGNDFHGTVGEIYQGRFLSAAASRFDDPTFTTSAKLRDA